MKTKKKAAVCVIESQFPLKRQAVAALRQSVQEWLDLLEDGDDDVSPAYFTTGPKHQSQSITPQLEKQIEKKYGWRPKYLRLIWI